MHKHEFKRVSTNTVKMAIGFRQGYIQERTKYLYQCDCGKEEMFYTLPGEFNLLETYTRSEVN